ncbi:LPS export ABC transporter periplasmic protein LptC [Kaarinaea lacus]
MLPKWFTPLTIAVVTGLSIWLLSKETPKQAQLPTSHQSVPDAFMENFTAYNLDNKGKTLHELSAEYMVHFPENDISEFTSPELILYRTGKKRWSVSARKGTTTEDISEIILQGEVNIHRLSSTTGEKELVINTSEILIRPGDNYLETEKEISLVSGKNNLQSVGIRADLDSGKVELLSHVRGVYAL